MGDTFTPVAQYIIKFLVLGLFWLQMRDIQFIIFRKKEKERKRKLTDAFTLASILEQCNEKL